MRPRVGMFHCEVIRPGLKVAREAGEERQEEERERRAGDQEQPDRRVPRDTVDAQPAVEPGLVDKPPEPTLPSAPEPPKDTTKQVALIQYFNDLQSYMDRVELIQTDYKNQMSLYESQAKVYEAEMLDYQKKLAKWEIARASAVQAAEGTIESIRDEYGWAWVNKDDPSIYRPWLATTWSSQVVISFVYFLLILGLIKRKDVK